MSKVQESKGSAIYILFKGNECSSLEEATRVKSSPHPHPHPHVHSHPHAHAHPHANSYPHPHSLLKGLETLSYKGQSGGCAMGPAGLPQQNPGVALLPWNGYNQWCLFPSQLSTHGNLAFLSTCRAAALVALTNFWQSPRPQIKITLIKARLAPITI